MTVPIIVTCYEGYRGLWPMFRYYMKKFKEHNAPVYLASEHGDASEGDPYFADIKTCQGEWSDRLIRALHTISDQRVFIMLEDYWLTEPWTEEQWQRMKSRWWDVLGAETKKVLWGKPCRYYDLDKMGRFIRDSLYAVSLEPGIWDRKFLLNCLQFGESAWQFETVGNKRMWESFSYPDPGIYFKEWLGWENVMRKGELTDKGKEMMNHDG